MPTKPSSAPTPVEVPTQEQRDPLHLARPISLDGEPRKPRLAWQGMERKELAGAVPTQVVEIIWPGRAVERKGELDLAARAAARDEAVRPENRLIWTNDNLVALQAAGTTQEQAACAAKMRQSELSRAERREDHLLSTLRRYAEGLGGELEVACVARSLRRTDLETRRDNTAR